MAEKILFEVHGRKSEMDLYPNLTLLWVLRYKSELTVSKYGCGMGFCGACSVLIDNEVALNL